MRTRTWVPGAAVLLLVLGVLATRTGTAASEADLAPPVAEAAPSAEPSTPVGGDVVLLEADGLEGMRLGRAPTGVDGVDGPGGYTDLEADDLPGRCEPVWSTWDAARTRTWEQRAWLVDGEVQAVVLTGMSTQATLDPRLRTWLGPTLGSPIEAASELPGAVTTVERPFGAAGPTVTVVHVADDGVEAVFSDAGYDLGGPAGRGEGRVRTLEVRLPRARACSTELVQDVLLHGGPDVSEAPPAPRIGRDGVDLAPLGTPWDRVRSLPGADGAGPTTSATGAGGCRAVFLPRPDRGFVRLVVVDGVVAAVEVAGEVVSDLGVGMGDGAAELQAAFPELAPRGRPVGEGVVEVDLGDRVVTVGLWPEPRWVPDVEVPVIGGPPLVQSLGVRDAAVAASRTMC